MNQALFGLLNSWAGQSPLLDAIGIFLAEYLIYAIILGAFGLGLWRRQHPVGYFVVLTVSIVLAWLVATELKILFATDRPFVALGSEASLLVLPSRDAAFPSGHTAATFAAALAVWWYSRRWGYMLGAGAVLVGLARIFVGVHWPIDVFGGAVVGLAVAWIVYRGSQVVLTSKGGQHRDHTRKKHRHRLQ